MSWEIKFKVRPADPSDRRDHPEAHEVQMMNGEKPIRTVGVWDTKRTANHVAATLNYFATEQIR